MTQPELQAFIAGMKLRELQRYRARLHALYDGVEQRAGAAASPVEALRELAEGLRAVEVAGRRVHPEVANLDVVLLDAVGEVPDPGHALLVTEWTARLTDTLRQGRARADAITLFGGVLGEWASGRGAAAEPGAAEAVEAGLALAAVEGTSSLELDALTARLAEGLGAEELGRMSAAVAEASASILDTAEPLDELGAVMGALAGDPERPASVSAALGPLLKAGPPTWLPHPAMGELYSALRMAWEDLAGWDWTGEVCWEARWSGTRWRVVPQPGLVDLLTVELLGSCVARLVDRVTGDGRRSRLARLTRLEELNAPAIIVENERRMCAETFDVSGASRPFTWLSAPEEPAVGAGEPGVEGLGEEGSVQRTRFALLGEVAASAGQTGYGGDDGYGGAAGIPQAFALVHAELELLRALQPEARVTVVKTDLQSFYPSMPHALVTGLLRWIGADARLIALVERVLRMPLSDGRRAVQGLPLGLGLSRALGRLVIAAMEGHVRRAADVLVLSLVDDVVVIARSEADAESAWAAIERFTQATGLRCAPDKTGSCCVPTGALDGQLLRGPVRWGLMELSPSGRWEVAEPVLTAFLAVTRARVEAAPTLLGRVSAWREQLRYLLTWLVPSARLDEGHPDRVWAAVRRFAASPLSGAGRTWPGVIAMLRGELSARFVDGAALDLPDAWLHWPVTAGGLGLPHGATEVVPHRRAREVFEAAPRPAAPARPDAEVADLDWGDWYATLTTLHAPLDPEDTEASRALVQAFIERGRRVRGDERSDLAPRWRWILATFGPAIVERFGRYDFLDTDLVPLEVIQSGFESG